MFCRLEISDFVEYVVRMSRDAPIIGIGQLSVILPVIGIAWLVCWYQPIVVYTIGKYRFLFLLPKVNMRVASISGKSGCIL